jgi:DNA-binding MarR family transcriptional regulator
VKKQNNEKKQRRADLRAPAKRLITARTEALVDSLRSDDATLREFIADLYAAMSIMRLLRREIATALSLTTAEYSVLLAVWYLDRAGDKTVRAISDHLHVAAAYVTSEVGRLVERGLLIKRPDPVDRRAVGVELTKSARGILKQLGPLLHDINAPLLDGLHYRDLLTVHQFLRNIVDHGYDAIRIAQSFSDNSQVQGRR